MLADNLCQAKLHTKVLRWAYLRGVMPVWQMNYFCRDAVICLYMVSRVFQGIAAFLL